jgi:hypothetical protein
MVNGSMLDPTDIAVGATYHSWPNMPAGDCTVKIENVTSGNYALRVGDPANDPDPDHAGFHFEGTVSPLRVYALVGSNTIIAWVHNRKFNIMDADTWSSPGVNVPAIINATVHFTGLTPSCSWTVEWWTDTTDLAGSASSTYQVSTDEDGNLNLVQGTNMPASILRDALVILTKN